MIDGLVADGYLTTPAIIAAFRATDRKDFVPPALADEAYGDYPLPIGFGQTISQPLTVAIMLELLAPRAGENILEIGSGSGWQTAILAHIVSGGAAARGGNGRVTAIERIPELAAMGEANVAKYSFIKSGVAEMVRGNGAMGFAPGAPYDRIIAAAAAARGIPRAWKDELRVGGRIVAPVGQAVVVSDKMAETEFRQTEHRGFSFVPLVED